jgi:hypothetical protein
MEKKLSQTQVRKVRLAKALKANLAKRKAQARAIKNPVKSARE